MLRKRESGFYWSVDRKWVRDWRQAENFMDVPTLVRTVIEKKIINVEVVLQMGDKPQPRYDVAIAIRDYYGEWFPNRQYTSPGKNG